MGRNQRLRKEQRLEQEKMELQAVEVRRQERVQPVVRTTKRVTMALLATVGLLYLGTFIAARLPEIVSRITETMH